MYVVYVYLVCFPSFTPSPSTYSHCPPPTPSASVIAPLLSMVGCCLLSMSLTSSIALCLLYSIPLPPAPLQLGNILNVNSVKILVALLPRCHCCCHRAAAAAKLLLPPPPPRRTGTAALPPLPSPPRTSYQNCHHAAATAAALLPLPSWPVRQFLSTQII